MKVYAQNTAEEKFKGNAEKANSPNNNKNKIK